LASGRLVGTARELSPTDGDLILLVAGESWPFTTDPPERVRGAVVLGVPAALLPRKGVAAVAGFDRDVLRDGEVVHIDGHAGQLTIEGVRETPVVTVFLQRPDGQIILLLRSERVGTYRGRWAGVSGYLEEPTPLEQAYREVLEETGLGADQLELANRGAPVLVREDSRVFIVHPFRFRVPGSEVHLDWETVKAEWVDPAEIGRRPTVPKLDLAWLAVSGSGPPKP